MPLVKGSASDFTRYQKLNAQSLAPTLKLTQASVVPVTLTLNGTIGAAVKASTTAAAVAPKTTVVAQTSEKVNRTKRG